MVPDCTCQAEAASRERERLEVANLPVPGRVSIKTFQNFEMRRGTEEALKSAQVFAAGRGPATLVLSGGPGAGKSHLLLAIGQELLRLYRRCRYEVVAEMLDRLRASYDGGTEDHAQVMDFYHSIPVLLLDDVGMERNTAWGLETLTSLVDYRIRNGLWLAVATNLSYGQMKIGQDGARFRLASRLFDTNTGAVNVVIMTAKDYRTGPR